MLLLRPYQEAAKAAVYEHLRTRDDNPCVVIPTGGGKTPVLASICGDAVTRWNGRVLIIAAVRELLEQAAQKLQLVCPEVRFGVYSAGLKRRDTAPAVILAGIQSVHKRACDFDGFDLVIVDEAHTIPPDGEGMYRRFLGDAGVVNPRVRVIGFTATPFRMKSGLICTRDNILNHVCFEVGVRELIRDGYLCPLVTKAGTRQVDTSALHVRGGEFVAGEVESLMDQQELVESACGEIVEYTRERHSVLVFASGVDHGRHVAEVLPGKAGVECGFVCGTTPAAERDTLLQRFKHGELKYLVNVNLLTTGFDASNVDCVAMLRPTLSPGLYYQMVGRGFRPHEGKRDCLVLDFGGNVLRHGPVDQVQLREPGTGGNGAAPAKECPECHALIAAGYAFCPECRHAFPPSERTRHEAEASSAGILSGQVTDTRYVVRDVHYTVHAKRDAPPDAPRSLRVDYRVGLVKWQSEFVCFEHTGYPRYKAVAWWRERSPDPVPETAERAVEIIEGGGLCHTEEVVVRSVAGEKYDRIVGYKLGSMPDPVDPIPEGYNVEDVPF